MEIGKPHLVTVLDGPWQVGSYVAGINWWIYNTKTGVRKKIGPATGKGVNYFDRAEREAKRRNALLESKEIKVRATEILDQAYAAITPAYMDTILPGDSDVYDVVIGPRIDRIEDTIDTLACLLMKSFDETLVVVLGTLIQRRKE